MLLVDFCRKGEVLTFLAMLLDSEKSGYAGMNFEDREGKIGRRKVMRVKLIWRV